MERPIRPIPKELSVTRPSSASMLWITVTSHDAAQWINQEAPLFGDLYPPKLAQHYTLFVSDAYDTDEVAAHLRTYASTHDSAGRGEAS